MVDSTKWCFRLSLKWRICAQKTESKAATQIFVHFFPNIVSKDYFLSFELSERCLFRKITELEGTLEVF